MLKAYAVSIKGFEWSPRIIHHESAGKAKYEFFLDVTDVYPDLKYTQITACRVGVDLDNAVFREFARTATYRDVPFAKIGMSVEVDGLKGEIAGKNSDANFDILFLEGPHKGQVLNCHPNWKMRYFDSKGELIKEFND